MRANPRIPESSAIQFPESTLRDGHIYVYKRKKLSILFLISFGVVVFLYIMAERKTESTSKSTETEGAITLQNPMDFITKLLPALQNVQTAHIDHMSANFTKSLEQLGNTFEKKLDKVLSRFTPPAGHHGENSPGHISTADGHHRDNSLGHNPLFSRGNSLARSVVDENHYGDSSSGSRKRGYPRSSESSVHSNLPRDVDQDDNNLDITSLTASNNLSTSGQSKQPHLDPEQALDPKQDLWAEVLREYETTETLGSEISPPLASSLKLMFSKKLAPEKLKERLEEVKIPSNCKILAVKSCNKPIWARKDQSRSKDPGLNGEKQCSPSTYSRKFDTSWR